MARLPSSRYTVHRGLWIPHLRAGDDSPLRSTFRHAALGTFPTQSLSTQRIRPCGLNVTSRTRSQPCADDWSLRLPGRSHDALAVSLQSRPDRDEVGFDAVRISAFTRVLTRYGTPRVRV